MFGAIELGGTKIVCGIGTETGDIIRHASIPTTDPKETMARVFEFFEGEMIEALGVGTFGPVDLNRNSDTYGHITTTPKVKWANYPLYDTLKTHFGVPVILDTDVNGAALGEMTFGGATDVSSCLYMTVGTGIGAGAVIDGKLVHGMGHPEMGHMMVRRHPDDASNGVCPYHGDCLEGLASGPAIEARHGKKAHLLELSDPAWDIEADYLAQALVNIALILAPQRMILGGGVMKQSQLFPKVRDAFRQKMNGYIQNPYVDELETYIVPPTLGDLAGLKGALALAIKKGDVVHAGR
ncbi:ROK family protein [Exiguobacterium qingdaonense]|uniref:ROK family protein n=1 Tax=Exiguobacterium qingdaonense TaxID=2751251 RepID=UPI001BE8583A|nr:ROK family protein [Exiguobacterium qingdaonense]